MQSLFEHKITNMLGSNAHFHHIGMAVDNIESAKIELGQIFDDPIQKVKVSFANINGARIEFIEPTSEQSPVNNSIKKGQKLVHLCFEVDSIDEAIQIAKENKFSVLSKPVPAVAFEGRNIIWLFHKVFGLIELIQRKK